MPQSPCARTCALPPQVVEPTRCWGCEYYGEPVDGEVYASLVRLISDNLGRMSTVELAREVHAFFEEEVVQPAQKLGGPAPSWPIQQIVAHLTAHTLEPTLRLSTEIRRATRVLDLLEETCVVCDETGAHSADPKVVDMMLRWQKQLVFLFGQQPRTMAFYDDAHDMAAPRLAQLVSSRREFKSAAAGSKRRRTTTV